jgi:hypothetical protein
MMKNPKTTFCTAVGNVCREQLQWNMCWKQACPGGAEKTTDAGGAAITRNWLRAFDKFSSSYEVQ